ncbi:MAG: hypothetical protein RLZZ444_2168 [Pseudomonadota bacterium]|jgi:mannose-6-phosphate isomerase-like protein (cupin superfamily)
MGQRSLRRIVTGHDETGKAIVLSDGEPPMIIRNPMQEGLAFYEVWNTHPTPFLVTATCEEPTFAHKGVTAPPAGGTVIRFVDIPPEGQKGPDLDAEQARKLFEHVGLAENADHHIPGRHPLMHRTESVDYGICISGEIVLLLDDSEVVLKPGDVVVQRGTIHAWTNRTNEIARMAFILTDGTWDPALKTAFEAHDERLKAQHAL